MCPRSSSQSNDSTGQASPINSEMSQQSIFFKAFFQEEKQTIPSGDETISSYSEEEQQFTQIPVPDTQTFGFAIPDFLNDKSPKPTKIQEKLQKYSESYEDFDIDPDFYMSSKDNYFEDCFFD